MPTSPRPASPQPANRSVGREGLWMALVHEGTVQQTFSPDRQDDGYRALAESALAVEAYHVPGDRTPPPVPGSKVDPQAWGWIPLKPAIEAGTTAAR